MGFVLAPALNRSFRGVVEIGAVEKRQESVERWQCAIYPPLDQWQSQVGHIVMTKQMPG